MIKPRVDELLERTDTHYAAVRGRGQARPPAQQLLPRPRRGHLRGVHAADGRDADRQLPHDRARGARRRARSSTATAPSARPLQPRPRPRLAGRSLGMARILLGVSGGIAAYKALELARLATKAGHGVRVRDDPDRERFVGAASFEGIVGAPVLIDEFERDPMRGAFPGDEPPGARPDRPPRARRRTPTPSSSPRPRRTRSRSSPPGSADSMLTTVLPRLHGAAARRAGDERPHVRATPRPRRTWRPCASAASP